LLSQGHKLTLADLENLLDHVAEGIFGGRSWPETHFEEDDQPPSESNIPPKEGPVLAAQAQDSPPALESLAPSADKQLAPIPLDTLGSGERLTQSIYSSNGILLLAKGAEVTSQFLDRLQRQGVYEVHTASQNQQTRRWYEAPSTQPKTAARLDRIVETSGPGDLEGVGPVRETPQLPLNTLREETCRGQEMFEQSVDRVAQITHDIFRGKQSAVPAALDVVDQFLAFVQTDRSLLPAIINLKKSPYEYLFQHGMSVALLSIAAASHLTLPREHLLEIGVGALLSDVGMMCVPEELRFAPRALTEKDRLQIAQHPLHTLSYLEKVKGLSRTTLFIAYQVHERGDSSGYPNNRHRMLTHPFARLVGIADTFTAICSHRPHRNAKSPYEAMKALLQHAGEDKFDRDMVRLFLDSMSLFPIASYVRLSDGTFARVLRANRRLHTKPVVLLLNADGSESDCELDLGRVDEPVVVEALRSKDDLSLQFSGT